MKKIIYIFVALLIAQNAIAQCTQVATATQEMIWTGKISTDWNDACNWSPNGIPTATNRVTITNVTNDPVILSGTIANCSQIDLGGILTVNSGGVLNILPTDLSFGIRAINIYSNATFTNNGTLNATTTANLNMIAVNDNATFNNSGTANLNSPVRSILMGGANAMVNNSASGIINFQSARGFQCINGTTGNVIINQGIMNYIGYDYFAALNLGFTLNNSGTIDIKSGSGIAMQGGTLNNLACAKILLNKGIYDNQSNAITNNAGLMITGSIKNTNGTFTNNGVLKYNSLSGSAIMNNQNSSVIVSNTLPIFTYGDTFNGTINGIFTDSLATISAGTFVAPNAFTPLLTLPKGVQKLYVKITPNGGNCAYILPFTFNNNATPTIDINNKTTIELHQNRPNPFNQETMISFNLTESDNATLTVFDLAGRQIFISNKTFKAGYNEVLLDKSIFQNSGTYFYRLTSDKYSVVKKMQYIME